MHPTQTVISSSRLVPEVLEVIAINDIPLPATNLVKSTTQRTRGGAYVVGLVAFGDGVKVDTGFY
jgi:hypothetical protein